MKLEFYRQIFEKYSNIKFHENPSIGSRVVACGQTDGRTHRRADMTKLIDAFRHFSVAPKTQGNNRCLFSDPHQTHKYTVWGRTQNLWMLNLVVHIVTTGLWRVTFLYSPWYHYFLLSTTSSISAFPETIKNTFDWEVRRNWRDSVSAA